MCADFVSVTARQSQDEIEKYWTKERIASAKLIVANFTATDTPKRKVDLKARIKLIDSKINGKNQVAIKATLGRLLFSIGNSGYACSANVVASENGDVIATARHCGFENGGENYRFAPGYDRGNAPHGWWTWRSAGWTMIPGGAGDFAFIVLNAKDGRHVQDVVGSVGLVFGRSPNSLGHIHLWGIPADKDYAISSEGQAGSRDDGTCVSIPGGWGGFAGGASGGAFLMKDNGQFYQIGTLLGNCGGEPCGPLFDNAALDVYNGAKNA